MTADQMHIYFAEMPSAGAYWNKKMITWLSVIKISSAWSVDFVQANAILK